MKSATDRVLDSIREKCQKVATCRKTNNWSLLLDEFDAVNKMVELKKTVLSKTGLPKFYVKMLTDVEDHVNSALKDKETLKKMKESLQRDINRMKLAVKKHNVKYESEIKDCREHPENYVEIKVESSDDESDDDSDDDEDEEDESEDEEGSDEDDDSDDDSLNDDDESDSDSDSDDGQQLKGRARWLKSTSLKPEKDKVKLLVVPKVRKEVKTADPAMQAAAAAAKRSIFLSSDDDMKEDAFNKKLAELLAQRGRKGMDPRDLLLKLEVLAKIAQKFGSRKEIQLMMHLVSATYDTNRVIDDYMDLNQWRTCARSLLRVTKLLESHASLLLGVTSADDVADGIISPAMKKKTADGDEDVVPVDDGKGPLKVVGTLEAFVQRLHDEYTKSLQQINPHTQVRKC